MEFDLNAEELEILRENGYSEDDIREFIKYKEQEEMNDSGLCKCRETTEDLCSFRFNYNSLPDLSKVTFIDCKEHTSLLVNNKRIEIQTPRFYLPFGIDKYYNHWSLNMEMDNPKCEGNKEFMDFISNLEKLMCTTLNISESELNTQLSVRKGVTSIYARIQNYNNRPRCRLLGIRDDTNGQEQLNIYRFPQKVYVKAKLRIGNIWKVNKMYCYKFNASEINIVG